MLQILKCNMDIQPVTGEMAIAFYIAKYISKSESPILRQEIQDAIDKINKAENLPAQKKMHRIAMTLLRNREVSSQEAAFRVCHLFLRKSTRATVFLPAYPKPDRYRMLMRESLNDDEPRFCLNMIDRY